MDYRKINLDTDYEVIANWLNLHNKPNMSRDYFSSNGYMINVNGEDIIAGFLYSTDSNVCFIENFISKPGTEKMLRRMAIDKLFKVILEEAKDKGFKLILTCAELHSLMANLKEVGFRELPSNKVFFRSL